MAATSTARSQTAPIRPAPRRALPWPIQFYRSAIGRKWVMAATGLMLVGFVVFHMLGNFKAYLGPDSINEYGEALRDLGGHLVPRTHLLWVMRMGLMAAFALHIHSAYSLKEMSRKASDNADYMTGQKKYANKQNFIAADFASRTMRWTGPIIMAYLVFHLADLTWGWVDPDWQRGNPYGNLSNSLSTWWISAIYVIANTALAIHLYHGVWSMFQSLGINNPRINMARRPLAMSIAGLVLIGNLSFPLMVNLGVLDSDNVEAQYSGQSVIDSGGADLADLDAVVEVGQ